MNNFITFYSYLILIKMLPSVIFDSIVQRRVYLKADRRRKSPPITVILPAVLQ